MDAHAHDVKKEVKIYITVFVALAALTVITVAISRLHLGLVGNITVALIIASIKVSLVACYFMHLISERKLIYAVLILTVIFLGGLMTLTVRGHHDTLRGTKIVS